VVLSGRADIALGEGKHVPAVILVGGGMFITRNKKHKPMELLEEFLEKVWWPGSIGRVPTKVYNSISTLYIN
jgi:hypothetical protein